MADSDLTRQEALELISSVVDDEVSGETKAAFWAFIEKDEEVRRQFESMKRIKQLMNTRCPCAKAPGHLREKITAFLKSEEREGKSWHLSNLNIDRPSSIAEVDPVPPSPETFSHLKRIPVRGTFSAAVAVILLITAVLLYLNNTSPPGYNVEEYAYAHFMNHQGSFIEPTIPTADINIAQAQLASSYNLKVVIPSLTNAEFKGVVYTDFVPRFKTPILEYHMPNENQYIYIFAFNIDDLEGFEELHRHEDAIKSCINREDFHVRNINGKHVVSWKWDDTWYAAISNHDGETLASIVEPLNYSNN